MNLLTKLISLLKTVLNIDKDDSDVDLKVVIDDLSEGVPKGINRHNSGKDKSGYTG